MRSDFMYNLIIVDDEQYSVNLMPEIIDWNSFNFNLVAGFTNSILALDYIKNNRVDIVISDIRMPEMNGIDFARHARNIQHGIVFIFISAYRDFSYAQQAIKLGAVDYIIKPLNYEDLEKCCKKAKLLLDSRPNSAIRDIPSVDSTAILRAQNFIRDNCCKDITLSDVAKHVYLSPQYFSTLFKEKTGCNFVDYLNKLRIEKAKYLLSNTELKISKICEMVGYGSRNHFYKMFKIYCDTTPQEYRSRYFSDIGGHS